jgi:hypothetical protein
MENYINKSITIINSKLPGIIFAQPGFVRNEQERKQVMDNLSKQTPEQLKKNITTIHTLIKEYNEKKMNLEIRYSHYLDTIINNPNLHDEVLDALREYDFVIFILCSLQITLKYYDIFSIGKNTNTLKTEKENEYNSIFDILIQIDDEKLLEREIKILFYYLSDLSDLSDLSKYSFNPMHISGFKELNLVTYILGQKIEQSSDDEKKKQKYRFILDKLPKMSGGKSRRRRRRRIKRRRRTQRR